jgi:hypothetical protein
MFIIGQAQPSQGRDLPEDAKSFSLTKVNTPNTYLSFKWLADRV